MRRRATQIGRVRHVLGSLVTVELDRDLAGVAPIYEGELQPIGQIGAIVRIPQGPITLIGTVAMVGIAELTKPLPLIDSSQIGDRWLQVQLLGELSALGVFERGVSTYPGLDDEVHLSTSRDLAALYPRGDERHIVVGSLSASPEVNFALQVDRLVTRHSAVVGSTGSGKTSAVSTIVQQFVRQGWTAANILIIDAHGEYAAALASDAQVIKVAEPATQLRVPYWALPAQDVLRALTGLTAAQSYFNELVVADKQRYAVTAPWVDVDAAAINAETPSPYNINTVWYKYDVQNRATVNGTRDESSIDDKLAFQAIGNAENLEPATFLPNGAGGALPNQGKYYGTFQTFPERLRVALKDPRLTFFLDVRSPRTDRDPLPEWVATWLGGQKPVSVLDFSGVPSAIVDLAVGAILTLLFSVAVRSDDTGIGPPSPLLIVLEEAHRYLSDGSPAKLAQTAVNQIAREGRKYGVGLMLISQRPSELPETALSQVGTMIALRLTNSVDQSRVKAALPDSVTGLADALPSLRNGEAIISGEASRLPSRVRVQLPDPKPDADDPSLSSWRDRGKKIDVSTAVARWRKGQ